MKTRLRLACFLVLLVLPCTVLESQETPELAPKIEIAITGISRGYAQPLRNTAKRIQALEGISDVKMLGWTMGTARFSIQTELDEAGLAEILKLKFICKTGTALLFAPVDNSAAKRAEARAAISLLGKAISKIYQTTEYDIDENGEPRYRPALQKYPRLKDKLKHLGLSVDDLDGKYYAPEDYNIQEEVDWRLKCRIWAGGAWEDHGSDNYGGKIVIYTSGRRAETKPTPLFVGMEISVYGGSQLQSRWTDKEAASSSTKQPKRSDKIDGKLVVKTAEEWLTTYMGVAVSYYLYKPKSNLKQLNRQGRWRYFDWFETKFGDNPSNKWWYYDGLNGDELSISWAKDGGKLVLTGKCNNKNHPFHLHAEVDVDAISDSYLDKNSLPDGKADLAKHVDWVVGAEDESVFERRRKEAKELHVELADLALAAMAKPDMPALSGSLANEDLCKAIGYTHSKDSLFKPEHIVIQKQPFGDIEISIGAPNTGGLYWVLVNGQTKKVYRSYQ